VACVHGLAGLAAVANGLPLGLRLGLLAAVLLGYLGFRREYAENARLRLSLQTDGRVELGFPSGAVAGTVLGSTLMTRWLVILHVRTDDGRRAVTICRDAVDPESFRLLKVWLVCTRPGEKGGNSV
jgi:hypothetical protein